MPGPAGRRYRASMARGRRFCSTAAVLAVGLLAAGCGEAGGATTVLVAPGGTGGELMERMAEVLRTRAAALGLDGASVQVDGTRLEVELDGELPDGALERLVDRGRSLAFRPVLEGPFPEGPGSPEPTAEAEWSEDREVVAAGDGVRYRLGPTALDGSVVESAEAVADDVGEDGSWKVNLTLRSGPTGIDAFNELAGTCYRAEATCPGLTPAVSAPSASVGLLAIVVDGRVVSAPAINADRFERDQIQISGAFGESEARALAESLRLGVLPVELEPAGD